jgi:hypothetical protein
VAGSGRISVFASSELRTLLAALKTVPRDVQKNVRQFTKTEALPMWQEEVRANVQSRIEARVLLKTARVRVSNQNVMLESAKIGRSLQGGARPSDLAAGVEFGANQDARTTYMATSRKGKRFTVTRRTQRQFRSWTSNGHVVFPAVRRSIPRFASLWIQTAARTLYDAFDSVK